MAETHWRITYRDITVRDPDKLIAAIREHVGEGVRIDTVEEAVEWLLDSVLDSPIDYGVSMGIFDVEQLS